MVKTDRVLWERELAEHMSRHGVDLLGLPAAEFPSGTRTPRWLAGLLLWVSMAVLGSTAGWLIGWYLI